MKKSFTLLLLALAIGSTQLMTAGCSCGFSCSGGGNGGGSSDSGFLTLEFSSVLPEGHKNVSITVDAITFRRSGAEDVIIDEFTISALDESNADTFKVNLLSYSDTQQLVVIEDQKLEPASYTEVWVDIIDDGENSSFVIDSTDNQRPIDLPDTDTEDKGRLVFSNLQVGTGAQTFTLSFGLAQALEFDSEDLLFRMTENGVRLEDASAGAALTGQVDNALFNEGTGCIDKAEPESGNRVYLYRGDDVTRDFADIFRTGETENETGNAVAPFAVASLDNSGDTWNYAFGSLPASSYTLVFSCLAATDDPVEFDGLDIPLPDNQTYQIDITAIEDQQCNLSSSADSC